MKVMATEDIGRKAKSAARKLATVTTGTKNTALEAMATALEANKRVIIDANERDLAAARAKGTNEGLLDRLMLNERRVDDMATTLRELIGLADPVGEVVAGWRVPNGLTITQIRVPLGVIGVIYEARPNVTVDACGLTLKAGDAVILRGGSMAADSNRVLADIVSAAATAAGIPEGTIQAWPGDDRTSVHALMTNPALDLLIPRGGPELIKAVTDNATVPVLWAGAGNCHIYVHKDADFDMADEIVINAKVQRPSVCNAAETLLVHAELTDSLLPRLVESLQDHDVVVYGCPRTRAAVAGVEAATEDDWYTEYLDLKIAVKVVDSVDEAIEHINTYGTLHSEAIVTRDYLAAKRFKEEVDAAAVYVNASTRFTDGGQFGMGAEIGISTQKLHARGPMGLTALTSTKFTIDGTGQVRS